MDLWYQKFRSATQLAEGGGVEPSGNNSSRLAVLKTGWGHGPLRLRPVFIGTYGDPRIAGSPESHLPPTILISVFDARKPRPPSSHFRWYER